MICSPESILSDVQSKLTQARERLADIEHEIEDSGRRRARAAEEFVGANPWGSIATAAFVAFLAGLAVSRGGRPSGAGPAARANAGNGRSNEDWLDSSG